ncbi:hypothetical protein CHU98_g10512 [Xylaria longipes]|nr:hypothetical protein CHU98_g10512 [Xylaria longipes]
MSLCLPNTRRVTNCGSAAWLKDVASRRRSTSRSGAARHCGSSAADGWLDLQGQLGGPTASKRTKAEQQGQQQWPGHVVGSAALCQEEA